MWSVFKKRNKSTPIGYKPKRLFILPTRYGLLFIAIVFFLMLFSLARHFLLFGSFLLLPNIAFLTALLLTHKAIGKIKIKKVQIHPSFVGQKTSVFLTLTSSTRFSSIVQCELENTPGFVLVTLETNKKTIVKIPFTPSQRGRLNIPKIGLSTLYPWGIAQAWTWIEIPDLYWAYPKLQGPSLKWMQENAQLINQKGFQSEEFYGIRTYKRGDDRRDIAWKASARSNQLMTRERPHSKKSEDLWLEWSKAPGEIEEKCSALAKWVIEADKKSQKFGLRLPQQVIPPSSGRLHRHQCLQALSLIKNKEKGGENV